MDILADRDAAVTISGDAQHSCARSSTGTVVLVGWPPSSPAERATLEVTGRQDPFADPRSWVARSRRKNVVVRGRDQPRPAERAW